MAPKDEDDTATAPPEEDALARAAALGPLPGIHESDVREAEETPIGQSVNDEENDLSLFNLRG